MMRCLRGRRAFAACGSGLRRGELRDAERGKADAGNEEHGETRRNSGRRECGARLSRETDRRKRVRRREDEQTEDRKADPRGATIAHTSEPAAPAPPPAPAPREPIFENVDQARLKARAEAASTPEHYNELGVRKYDFPALLRRIRDSFHKPTTMNPRLVSYLAAGGVQGLRPMRYEKRVARNRLIVLVIFLFLLLVGVVTVFVRSNR